MARRSRVRLSPAAIKACRTFSRTTASRVISSRIGMPRTDCSRRPRFPSRMPEIT
jgi:hypothetical protein